MSGIVGIVNFDKDISGDYPIIRNMSETLKRRGPDYDCFYFSKHINLAYREVSINKNEKKIISYKFNEITYTIVLDGQIYNLKEIKEILKDNDFDFKDNSKFEILIKAYIFYGKEMCKYLNGNFALAIWNDKKEEIYIARDRFGINPLYYAKIDENIIFASEIKAILEYPNMKAIVNKDGVGELLGIGPSHSPGKTPFKNIEELEPATFVVYNKNCFRKEKYWKLENKEHKDDLEKTCDKIRYLIKDSVERQLADGNNTLALLSGGIDSSIISKYASDYYKNKFGKRLKTFSVDYIDQEKNFVKNDFQPNTDNYYIDQMVDFLDTEHTKILFDSPDLYNNLENAMIARDFPGMADVDSSYLLLFKALKQECNIGLSGECSDEIFGGYPWYFREDSLNSNTFPWSLAIEERQKMLNEDISKEICLKSYIEEKYEKSLIEIENLNDDESEVKYKKMIYLTSNWFMQTLLDRTDRMCMFNGFEVRVPFCDYRIVEYVWNIPWKMKAYKNREKGLLRYSFKDLLPEEIVYRKKSPYPKTHNPNYLKLVKKELSKIINCEYSPINKLLNKEYIQEIIETDGKSFSRPWFGQLMTGPQLMAYIIQINMWLERYNPQIEI